MAKPFLPSAQTLALIEEIERVNPFKNLSSQLLAPYGGLGTHFEEMAAAVKASTLDWQLPEMKRLVAGFAIGSRELERLVEGVSATKEFQRRTGMAVAAKDFEDLLGNTSLALLRREIDATVASYASTFAGLEDIVSRNLSQDLAGLGELGIGARIGLDDLTAAILGLRTQALLEVGIRIAGEPSPVLALEAALQGRVVRIISEPSGGTGSSAVRGLATSNVEDRLPQALERWDPKLAKKLRRQRANVAYVTADSLRTEGWVVGWRKLLERILRDATPKMRSRKPKYGARFQAVVELADPATTRAVSADRAAFDALIVAISAPAHELEVHYTSDELMDVRLRCENFLITIIGLARPELLKS